MKKIKLRPLHMVQPRPVKKPTEETADDMFRAMYYQKDEPWPGPFSVIVYSRETSTIHDRDEILVNPVTGYVRKICYDQGAEYGEVAGWMSPEEVRAVCKLLDELGVDGDA